MVSVLSTLLVGRQEGHLHLACGKPTTAVDKGFAVDFGRAEITLERDKTVTKHNY